MPLFELSSQFRHWRYSKEELAAVRDEVIEQAVQRVKDNIERERAQLHPATNGGDEQVPAEAVPPPPDEIEYLTVDDEVELVKYYLTQVSSLCGAFRFSENVQATAMTYLKRFYLRNTCMDYHPKNVMLTCVFLATKTENCPCSIDSFASKVKTPTEDILSLEFLVSQSLRFEYKVHHAHLAAGGLLLDMQTASIPLETLEQAYTQSRAYIRASRLTDLEFIYTPAQIALASFRLTDPKAVESWLGFKQTRRKRYVISQIEPKSKMPTSGKSGKAGAGTAVQDDSTADENGVKQTELDTEKLIDVLALIGDVILEAKENPVDKVKVTDIDKRLRWARNPDKNPNSLMYKKRQAQEQAYRDEKAKQRAAAQPPNDDGSVFD
ncbi:hypothetical protein OIV83_001220 [Microbotryomycetes sp. JL201]|nr:hypothetical protein OIV83_001220 [Microbotryomycetes sp. JL201]